MLIEKWKILGFRVKQKGHVEVLETFNRQCGAKQALLAALATDPDELFPKQTLHIRAQTRTIWRRFGSIVYALMWKEFVLEMCVLEGEEFNGL